MNTQVLLDGIRRGRLATLMNYYTEQAESLWRQPELVEMYERRWWRCYDELLKLI